MGKGKCCGTCALWNRSGAGKYKSCRWDVPTPEWLSFYSESRSQRAQDGKDCDTWKEITNDSK